MELLLTIAAWLFVAGALFLLPFLLFVSLRFLAEKSHRAAFAAAGILLAAELIAGTVLYFRPIYVCPEEYAERIAQEREAAIQIGFSPGDRGFLSARLPLLAVVNEVIYVSENGEEIHVRTWYFPMGQSACGVSPDGLFSLD